MARGRTRDHRGRITPLAPVLLALVVGGALFFVVASADRGNGDAASTTTADTSTSTTRETTPPTAPAPDPVPLGAIAVDPFPEAPPDSYRITYDVVENGIRRSESVTVVRPFRSLVISTRGDDVISGTATSVERLWTYLDDRDGWLVLQPQLHRAAYDQRPLAAMATMIALGRAEELEPSTHLGRECRVFRTGEPLSNPGASAPTEAESTEACIDGSGLILHERWEISGEVVTERTATGVELGVDVPDEVFDPTPVVDDAPEFEALLSTIAVPADEETLARLQTDITPPDGFAEVGSVLRAGSPDRSGTDATEIVRFYTDGRDLIEVAEVTALAGAELDGGGAVPVEIDGPETWFVPDFRASAFRTRLSDTTFVELRGTDPAQLAGLLDTLTRR